MFKNIALAMVMTIGTATAASAATFHPLPEWVGFAEETATPVPAYSKNIDWQNLYSDGYALNEWNGFGEETATPVATHSSNIDWANLYL